MVTCEFEDGGRASLRHMTNGAIVVSDGMILLVKRADFLLEGGKWAIPGGYLDFDETALQGITREVLEETGYEITGLQLFKVITHPHRPNENNRQNVEFVWTAQAGNKVADADDESAEVKWFLPADIPWSEMAFDHGDGLRLYLQHLETPLDLPVID